MQKFLGLQLFLLDLLRLWGLFAPLLTAAIWGQHAAEEFCLLLVIELQEKVNQICFKLFIETKILSKCAYLRISNLLPARCNAILATENATETFYFLASSNA